MNVHASSEQRLWLFSRRADFWLACGGASLGILAAVLLILWHGDRELDALDFVLSEFHLGATYDAVIRRRLWRRRGIDVVLVPLLILALTYALFISGQTVMLTTIALYTAVWHRGRQNFGVARFYQRQVGGPMSRGHDLLFRGAVYLPMLAALLTYTHMARMDFDGKPYLALNLGTGMTSVAGLAAIACVIIYLAWALTRSGGQNLNAAGETPNVPIHPGERWVVLANAAAFGSGYVLGASNASFLLVLAVHHEVQYLYFAYAMSCRSPIISGERANHDAKRGSYYNTLFKRKDHFRFELKHAASFLAWPVIGFGGAVAGGWLALEWLAPVGAGGLFCHYWLDGRIWTRRSLNA